jgi:hypothetical protein
MNTSDTPHDWRSALKDSLVLSDLVSAEKEHHLAGRWSKRLRTTPKSALALLASFPIILTLSWIWLPIWVDAASWVKWVVSATLISMILVLARYASQLEAWMRASHRASWLWPGLTIVTLIASGTFVFVLLKVIWHWSLIGSGGGVGWLDTAVKAVDRFLAVETVTMGLGWLIVIWLVLMLIPFFFVASGFRTLGYKVEEKLTESLDHSISKISSELTQMNLNAAALHVQIGDVSYSPVVPDHVLRALDDGLRVKEAVASLENVIQTRQRNVKREIDHYKEEREKARRAVTAAAGGIFVGYFTYEAGEAVLKYIHVKGRADDRDLWYWLHAPEGHRSSTEGQSSSKDVLSKADIRELKDRHLNTETSTAISMHEVYEEKFHHHELLGQATLLTITLFVSLLAAWLGWRKPPEEQAGGHGGHH